VWTDPPEGGTHNSQRASAVMRWVAMWCTGKGEPLRASSSTSSPSPWPTPVRPLETAASERPPIPSTGLILLRGRLLRWQGFRSPSHGKLRVRLRYRIEQQTADADSVVGELVRESTHLCPVLRPRVQSSTASRTGSMVLLQQSPLAELHRELDRFEAARGMLGWQRARFRRMSAGHASSLGGWVATSSFTDHRASRT
jgi:hypothetical protein